MDVSPSQPKPDLPLLPPAPSSPSEEDADDEAEKRDVSAVDSCEGPDDRRGTVVPEDAEANVGGGEGDSVEGERERGRRAWGEEGDHRTGERTGDAARR